MFRKCIVFIDDDVELLNFLTHTLSPRDIEVVCFNSHKDAIEQIDSYFPSVVFIDYQMPDGDGLVLLKKLNKIIPESIKIMLTGEGSELIAVKAIKNGAHDYLVKPVDIFKLEESLDEAFHLFFTKIINIRDRYEYSLNDIAIARYEFLRASYSGVAKNIKTLCKYFKYSRQDYYNYNKRFKIYGPVGLLKKKDFEKIPNPEIYKRDCKKITSMKDFLSPDDDVQVKLEMFREAATVDNPNISDISKKYGLTREAFYQTYRFFKIKGVFALTEKKKGRPSKYF